MVAGSQSICSSEIQIHNFAPHMSHSRCSANGGRGRFAEVVVLIIRSGRDLRYDDWLHAYGAVAKVLFGSFWVRHR